VVAEPFQGASIHAGIMTHQGGKVESPCPFRSIRRANEWRSFPRDTREIGADPGNRARWWLDFCVPAPRRPRPGDLLEATGGDLWAHICRRSPY